MPHRLILSSRFSSNLKKLLKKHPGLRSKIKAIMYELQLNPHTPSLKLHKLSGRQNWSISVTYDVRIILHWQGENLYLTNIGTHDEVY
jgi:mRNA-degrading endonuclease YafQ of YafQ-DinJ toxin-antitoxin module